MSIPTLQITEPGLFTTVQDRGRYGYQRLGVPVSGAMDEFALRAANLLVGNDEGAAGLEMTVIGPDIAFLSDTWIAVAGADLTAQLDGETLERWQSVQVSAGSTLTFRDMQDGMRAYLAVAGGIDVPLVMGSRSTYVDASIGGVDGRALKKGDVISALPVATDRSFVKRQLPDGFEARPYGQRHQLRVVLGPQQQAFGPEAIATLLSSTYSVSLDSDRMGYKLDGSPVVHQSGADIVSDGNPPGAVQVPGDGTPTILLADRGTTGGYTKIATVISSDLGKLAQAVPGHTVTFEAVTVEEAHEVYREMEAVLEAIARQTPSQAVSRPGLGILVDGEPFEVVDEGGQAVTLPGSDRSAKSARRMTARATVDGQTHVFQVEVRRDDGAGA